MVGGIEEAVRLLMYENSLIVDDSLVPDMFAVVDVSAESNAH